MRSISMLPTAYYTENNTRYVFIDGKACRSLAACFSSLQEQLSVPAYFGNNLDALEEVLDDLEWIPETQIKIILFNKGFLLEHDAAKKDKLLDVLHTGNNDKVQIIYVGEKPPFE